MKRAASAIGPTLTTTALFFALFAPSMITGSV